MIVSRFAQLIKGDSRKVIKNQNWIEIENLEKVYSDKDIIHPLWEKWIVWSKSERYVEGEYLVFDFQEPVEIFFELKE